LNETIHNIGNPGDRLFSIVTEPDSIGVERIGIVFSGPGLHYRGYYFRIAVMMARKLTQEGYFTIRYDPFGVGDSDGELSPDTYNKYFNQVEKGMFKQSHISASEFFKDKYKLDKVFSIGLCGGGITSLISSETSDIFDGIISCSAPIWILDPDVPQDKNVINKEGAKKSMMRYGYSLLKLKSIWRFITLRADYKKILMVIKRLLIPEKESQQVDTKHSVKGLNKYFVDAFWNTMKKKIPVLIALAEFDAVTTEYKNRFSLPMEKELIELKELYHEVLIKNANHKYSDTDCQKELVSEILDWLNKKTDKN